MKFESAADRWIYLVAVASMLLLVVTVFRLLSGEVSNTLAGVIIFSAGLPVWVIFSTYYQVSGDLLLIKTGPFSWRIKLTDIQSAKPSRSLISSPALSLNRIELRYGQGKRVLVSPKDQPEFLRAIGHAHKAS